MKEILPESPPSRHSRCRWCAEEMNADAVYCKQCKKSQNRLIEYVYVFGGTIGVLTLVSGLLSYLFDDIVGRINDASEPRVQVIDYNSKDSISIHNIGKRKIIVSGLHVKLHASLGQSRIVSINKAMEPGEIHVSDLKEAPIPGEIFERVYLMGVPRETIKEDKLSEIRDGLHPDFVPIIYHENNVESRNIKSDIQGFEVECYLEYSAAGDVDIRIADVPCKAVVGMKGRNRGQALCRFQRLLLYSDQTNSPKECG